MDESYLSVFQDSHGISYYSESPISTSELNLTYNGYQNTLGYINKKWKNIPILNSTTTRPLTSLSLFLDSIYGTREGKHLQPTGILPPGLLYLGNNYLIFERPPSYQNVSIIASILDEINYEKNHQQLYRLPIPWQVYIVNYVNNPDEEGNPQFYTANVRMHFSPCPIMSFDQPIYLPPMNNFYTNGDLCRPMYDSMDDIERYTKDIAGVMASAYDWVWNSGTNLDLTNCIVQEYLQLKNNIFDVTPFCKSLNKRSLVINVIRNMTPESYYCQFPQVDLFLSSWEECTLEEVLQFQWPNPSNSRNLRDDMAAEDNAEARIEFVLSQGGVDDEYLHYDEDTDNYYHCGDRYCECMGGDTDWSNFYVEQGIFPPAEKTLRTSFNSFVGTTMPPQDLSVSSYFVEYMASTISNKINES